MRKFLTACAITALASSAVLAQETDGFLSQLGARQMGEIGNMPAHVIDGVDMVWLDLPGGHVMGGFLFDLDGRDLGAALIGADPLNVYDTLGFSVPDFLVQEEMEPASMDDDADQAFLEAVAAIQALPDENKRRQLLELLLAMSDAKSADELASKVVTWGQGVAGPVTGEAAPAVSEVGERMPEVGMAAIQPDRDPVETPALGAAPGEASALETASEGDASDRAEELASAMADAFWISLGNPSAPPVYMVLDPSCPYCAKAVANLQSDVEAGDIELRVLMAPIVSERAIPLVAGVLQAEHPAEALWNHELEYARNGASRLALAEFADLDPEMVAEIEENRRIFLDFELPGVPFFLWAEDGGVRMLSGVPQGGHFSGTVE